MFCNDHHFPAEIFQNQQMFKALWDPSTVNLYYIQIHAITYTVYMCPEVPVLLTASYLREKILDIWALKSYVLHRKQPGLLKCATSGDCICAA